MTVTLDTTATRLVMNELGRLRLDGPQYASCPREETANGNRYSVALRDMDGRTVIALVVQENGMAKDMGVECEVKTHTHLFPADFKGVEIVTRG